MPTHKIIFPVSGYRAIVKIYSKDLDYMKLTEELLCESWVQSVGNMTIDTIWINFIDCDVLDFTKIESRIHTICNNIIYRI